MDKKCKAKHLHVAQNKDENIFSYTQKLCLNTNNNVNNILLIYKHYSYYCYYYAKILILNKNKV